MRLAMAPSAENLRIPAPVSAAHCLPHASVFKIVENQDWWGWSSFRVVDADGNLLYESSASSSFWSPNLTFYDVTETPLLQLLQKRSSTRGRWDVFRGADTKELLFTVKSPSPSHRERSYTVWLSGNEDSEAEFTLNVDFWKDHFEIRHHDDIIAEVDRKAKLFKANELIVSAKAGVDRMFIAAILVIYLRLRRDGQGSRK